MLMTRTLCWTLALIVGFCSVSTAQQPIVEEYLLSGRLTEGEAALEKHLAANLHDDQAHFGLGTLRFLQSIEHLSRSWYEFGINNELRQVPFFRLPVEENPNPKKVNYEAVRSVFKTMIERLEAADEALSKIKSKDVKLPLHMFQLHFDINRDEKLTPNEDLSKIYGQYFGNEFAQPGMHDTVVAFDYSDALWMRGYTCLLRSMLEIMLAYDEEPLWDVIGHRVFERVEFKFKFLEEEYEKRIQANKPNRRWYYDQFAIMDYIAGIHNLNFKMKEPGRMKRAHAHLKQMIVHSRAMWDSILAEEDNDREWIPGPNQTSAVSQAQVSDEMIKTWGEFLGELDMLLDGKKLVPFWRGTDKTRGVNLKRFFLEPRDLDIVLMVHGSGAQPFIEFGDITKEETWRRFQRIFRGEFFGFAIWFN